MSEKSFKSGVRKRGAEDEDVEVVASGAALGVVAGVVKTAWQPLQQ